MLHPRGSVLLVPFPFADLTGSKARPVVVLSSAVYQRRMDAMIVAMLTSMPRHGPYDVELRHWEQAGLLLPTWARAKLATLTTRLIHRPLGRLSGPDLRRVDRAVRSALAQG